MKKEWAIQQFNEALQLWEFITPKDQLMAREKMTKQLKIFEEKFPEIKYRGHNLVNCSEQGEDSYK